MKPRTVFPWLPALFALPLMAQEGKLIVPQPQSKELKRTAHRLGIPAEQLRHARRILQEATDLACRLDPAPLEGFQELASLWQQIDPKQAQAAVNPLIGVARSIARDATSFPRYQQAAYAAFTLAGEAFRADFEAAHRFIRDWPPPPESAGKGARDYLAGLERHLRQQSFQYLAQSDPDRALPLLYEQIESDPGDASIYWNSAQVARMLLQSSRQEEAFRLIDRMMDCYARNSAGAPATQAYESFLSTVMPLLDGERAAAALARLIAESQTAQANCAGSLVSGQSSIELSCVESRVLRLVRYTSKPGLIMKALEELPGLKAKLDAVGGIDVLFQPRAPVEFRYASARGGYITQGGSAMMPTPDTLYRELRTKRTSDPEFVRARIREVAGRADGIPQLINLAHMAAHSDPELAEMALKEARLLVACAEPLERRSSSLQALIGAYRHLDGEVDPDLLRAGFILVDEMRRQEAERESGFAPTGQPAPGSRIRSSDSLESFLVGETAREDLDAALRYIRPLPAPRRFECLLAMARALSQRNY